MAVTYLRRVVGKYTRHFEEMSTVLSEVEACLNSRPLGIVPCNYEKCIEVLTPKHLLIWHLIQVLPDCHSSCSFGLLRIDYFCQILARHLERDGNTLLLYKIYLIGSVSMTIFK